MTHNVRKRTSGQVRTAKIQISLRIRRSESSLGAFGISKDAKFLHADNEDSDKISDLLANMSESTFSYFVAHVRYVINTRKKCLYHIRGSSPT